MDTSAQHNSALICHYMNPPDVVQRHVKFLQEALQTPTLGLICDIGCGYGYHSVGLAKCGHGVVAFEKNEFVREQAVEAATNCANLSVANGPFTSDGYEEKFDGAIALGLSAVFKKHARKDLLSMACKILKPKRRLVISLPVPQAELKDACQTWEENSLAFILKQTSQDAETRGWHTDVICVPKDGSPALRHRIPLEYEEGLDSLAQVWLEVEQCGFKIVDAFGSLDSKDTYTRTSDQLVLLCEKGLDWSYLTVRV